LSTSPAARRFQKASSWLPTLLRAAVFLFLLYVFFCSIEVMSTAFMLAGEGFAERLIATVSDPIAGLLLGFVATAVIQSSSTTTTIVVGLVAGTSGLGTPLSIELAIPIIMGANVGTTTTAILVSLGHVTRPEEFERAFAASTVHDFFNVLAALTILPLELLFHPVQKVAVVLQGIFADVGGMSLSSPLKAIVGPVAEAVANLVPHALPLAIIGLAALFLALQQMVRVMRGAIISRLENLFNRVLFRNDAASFGLGLVTTATVQSSSATTSLVIPLAGTGVLSLRQIYPYTLGANVGTTVTTILGSLATGNAVSVTVALAHLTFNVFGILIYYPLAALPIWLATKAGKFAGRSRRNSIWAVVIFLATIILPLLYIFFS
jgi:sodium-dependent phosphate cotransporter